MKRESKVKIGCSIIILWLLTGCSCQDHSRNFIIYDSEVLIEDMELLLDKGNEESTADNKGTLKVVPW